ncbi:Uncharacterised protein [Amycolatopsis camponoti]|uniref:Uncharacterized protein n=2 Tax=Pseudonocardiaceae TaxID=2070 RepID=A0A6I8LUT1_9PSEU|nr:Uncharacterised protein [Amycolatopsis camponoti]
MTRIARGEEVDTMTVQARRYGRWCREHFDVVAAQGVPAPRPADTAEVPAPPEPEPVKPVAEQPQS